MVVAVEYISKEESEDVESVKHGVTGILAVQGAFAEHAAMLDKLGAPWKLLRAAEDFDESIDRVDPARRRKHHAGQAAAFRRSVRTDRQAYRRRQADIRYLRRHDSAGKETRQRQ